MSRRERKLDWRLSGDPIHPWETTVDGARWRARINDFPEEEFVYSLLVDGKVVEEFNDWPPAWTRPPLPKAGAGTGAVKPPVGADDPNQQREFELEQEKFQRTKDIPPSKLVK